MATPRAGLPYLYVTWLTKILAGEDQCVGAVWFKAHYQYAKVPSEDSRLAQWNQDHTALIRGRHAQLVRDGYKVSVEHANKITLTGQRATVGGKMDLVAERGQELRILDGKTGTQKNSDWWQMLIYFFLVSLAWPERVQGKTIVGELVYKAAPDRPMIVPYADLTDARRQEIVALIKRVSAATPIEKTPSQSECQYCDIPASDCPARFGEGQGVGLLTSEF